MDEKKPLISVIVPIYNVAPWLCTCLDSLRKQSLEQIEVICIDDGSTDESGIIAEKYKNEDWPLFRVIHHSENKGLSATRNHGIEEAQSPWIMFVDSDDWVETNFCGLPYMIAIENKADMVVFQNHNATEQGKVKRKKHKEIQTGIVDHETAIDIGLTQSWNKLYKKHLFNGLRYPEGHVYEDYAITHRLVYRAKNIVSISERLYYYRYRKGSICHSTSGEKDRLDFSKRRYGELIALGYPECKARAQLLGAALRCSGRANRRSVVYLEANKLLRRVRGIPKECSNRDELMMRIWRFHKGLYRFLYRKYMILMKCSE